MIYDTSKEHEKEQAITRFKHLVEKGKRISITVKHPRKSVQFNAYSHLLFSYYAISYGETMEYVKQEVFKKVVNPEIFKTEHVNRITGEIRTAWRSFAELDTGETTTAIERFRNYSSKEAGIYLPEPSDLAFLDQIEVEIIKHKNYL